MFPSKLFAFIPNKNTLKSFLPRSQPAVLVIEQHWYWSFRRSNIARNISTGRWCTYIVQLSSRNFRYIAANRLKSDGYGNAHEIYSTIVKSHVTYRILLCTFTDKSLPYLLASSKKFGTARGRYAVDYLNRNSRIPNILPIPGRMLAFLCDYFKKTTSLT